MKFSIRNFNLLFVAVALCASRGVLAAEVEGSTEVHTAYLGKDAWRFGNIAGENEKGLALFLNFDLHSMPLPDSGETGYWRVQGQRLGLDTGRIVLETGEHGTQRLRLQYRGFPTYQFDDAVTPLRRSDSTTLTLPQGWQGGTTTAGMTSLQESLVDLNLWRRRHTLRLDYRRNLDPRWTLNVDFRRDQVDGTRALGGVTGAAGGNVSALLLPAPVDYETHIAALTLAYSGNVLRWNLGYQGSFFDNGTSSLTWPTAFSQHSQWGPGTGFPDGRNQLALEPDNQAHQVNMNGNVVLGGNNRLYLDAILGRLRQNDSFLPYTVNTRLAVSAALPRTALNARVDTARINLRLTSRPLPRMNLVTRLCYLDRDNRTPIAAWQRVRGDAVNQQGFPDARLNRPYGLSESKAGVDAAYRLSSSLRMDAAYEYTSTDRNYSEIQRMNEHSMRLGLRNTGFDKLALALDYFHQRRRTDDYVGNRPLIATHVPGTIDAEDFENHPLLHKYYLNERDRDQWRLHADWSLTSNLSLGTALAHSRDDYPLGFFGLNESTLRSATIDINYTLVTDLRLSTFINHDRYHYEQTGRSFRGSVPADAFNPQRNWQVATRDRFNTVGFNLNREHLRPHLGDWQPAGFLDLALDLSHSRSKGEITTSVAADLNSAPLPALGTRIDTATLSARYAWSEQSSVRFALMWERYNSDDFALDNVLPASAANVLLPGYDSPHYQTTWTSVSYRHQF